MKVPGYSNVHMVENYCPIILIILEENPSHIPGATTHCKPDSCILYFSSFCSPHTNIDLLLVSQAYSALPYLRDFLHAIFFWWKAYFHSSWLNIICIPEYSYKECSSVTVSHSTFKKFLFKVLITISHDISIYIFICGMYMFLTEM